MESEPNQESEEFKMGMEVKRYSRSKGIFEEGWQVIGYNSDDNTVSIIKSVDRLPDGKSKENSLANLMRIPVDNLRKWQKGEHD